MTNINIHLSLFQTLFQIALIAAKKNKNKLKYQVIHISN